MPENDELALARGDPRRLEPRRGRSLRAARSSASSRSRSYFRGRPELGGALLAQLRGRGGDASRSSAAGCWWPPASRCWSRCRRLPGGRRRWPGACGGSSGGAEQVARGALHRAAAGRLRGRAGPAHAHVQRDAGAAAPGRRGAQGVHRHRLARAAHADLLARRLRRAAAGRGARRGDPARVPRHDGRAGGAPAEAGRRPARPVAPRRRLGRARRASRSTSPSSRGPCSASSRPAVDAPRDRARAASSRRPASRPAATANGWLRSCVSCSTTPSATPPRART